MGIGYYFSPTLDDFDLDGVDRSWSGSLWMSTNEEEQSNIPQLDGMGDEKTGKQTDGKR